MPIYCRITPSQPECAKLGRRWLSGLYRMSARYAGVPAPCGGVSFPVAQPLAACCGRRILWVSCRPQPCASWRHYPPVLRLRNPKSLPCANGGRYGSFRRVRAGSPRLHEISCRSSVVEHPLGKGEVECSIHSGSTSGISRIPLYPYK